MFAANLLLISSRDCCDVLIEQSVLFMVIHMSHIGMSRLCSFFYLLCYALIPELLPIMLFKMCLLFLNYAAVNNTNQLELCCIIMEVST